MKILIIVCFFLFLFTINNLCLAQILPLSNNNINNSANSSMNKTLHAKSWKYRAADHLMFQFGYTNWAKSTDSIRVIGFGRSFNAAAMYDLPFRKHAPHFSLAFGLGVSSNNVYFSKTYIDIKSNSSTLPFQNVADTNQFNKFKLTTTSIEIPVELRYFSNPYNTNKSIKVAIGFKVSQLLSAYTKGKDYQNRSGQSIYGASYISKESSLKFFNGTNVSGTFRIGYSLGSVFFTYQLTNLLKTGAGPSINPFTVGIAISGL